MDQVEGDIPGDGTITVLLRRANQGDQAALDRVFDQTYEQLRKVAYSQLRRASAQDTLDITSLISSACERLLGAEKLKPENRRHFYFMLDRAMHDVVVDVLRKKNAGKRGAKWRRVPMAEVAIDGESHVFEAGRVQSALEELGRTEPEMAKLVRLRFFCGCSVDEAAELMEQSSATTRRNWTYARAWLRERLERR
jgi:RNA polymerase sigma factor (TIGR02999 family)